MNRVTHAAGRKVFSRIVDHELSQISKNREQAYEKSLILHRSIWMNLIWGSTGNI